MKLQWREIRFYETIKGISCDLMEDGKVVEIKEIIPGREVNGLIEDWIHFGQLPID